MIRVRDDVLCYVHSFLLRASVDSLRSSECSPAVDDMPFNLVVSYCSRTVSRDPTRLLHRVALTACVSELETTMEVALWHRTS